jgi:hypothetical protein
LAGESMDERVARIYIFVTSLSYKPVQAIVEALG